LIEAGRPHILARMALITDEHMREMLPLAKPCTVVILKSGPNRKMAGVEKIIWEHGRRNMSLREDGMMPIVCPVVDGSDLCGVAVFVAGADEVKRIMDVDPGVKAGVFLYEVHEARGFPGSQLP
jgi:hypothetical protein